MTGLDDAFTYSYSSARVKAMESALIDGATMQHIIDAPDIHSALSFLFQTSYKESLVKYGGMEIKKDLVDFALSRNFAESVNRLVSIAPTTQRKLVRALIGKWDLYNVRLAIEAKEHGKPFESISMYITDNAVYNQAAIREAMREGTVEGVLSRLAINSPYAQILKDASAAYSRSRSVAEAITAIDIGYYDSLSSVMYQLNNAHYQSALIVKMEIDMKNLLTLIRSKRLGLKFQFIERYLISNGTMDKKHLEQLFNSSSSLEEMVQHVTTFPLKDSLEVYRRTRQLLAFEIGMNNYILNQGLKVLKPAILSFGTILAYIYLKELEVYTIRIAINSKVYGLDPEEVSMLIAWRK